MYTCFVPLLEESAQTFEPLSCTAQLVGHPCFSPAVEALHEKLLQAYESDVDECRGWEFGATGLCVARVGFAGLFSGGDMTCCEMELRLQPKL